MPLDQMPSVSADRHMIVTAFSIRDPPSISCMFAPHAFHSREERPAFPPRYFISDVVLAPLFVASDMARTLLTLRDAGAMLGGAVGATGAYYVGQPLAGHAITAAMTGAGAGSIYMPITVSATSSSPSWSHHSPTKTQTQTQTQTRTNASACTVTGPCGTAPTSLLNDSAPSQCTQSSRETYFPTVLGMMYLF